MADQPGPQNLTTAAAHQLIADLVLSGADPAEVCVWASAGGWKVTIAVAPAVEPAPPVPPPPSPPLPLTPCERDILSVLSADTRLTTGDVLAALERRGLLHGERTIKGALAALVRRGRILTSRRAPRGYHLPMQLSLFPA